MFDYIIYSYFRLETISRRLVQSFFTDSVFMYLFCKLYDIYISKWIAQYGKKLTHE